MKLWIITVVAAGAAFLVVDTEPARSSGSGWTAQVGQSSGSVEAPRQIRVVYASPFAAQR